MSDLISRKALLEEIKRYQMDIVSKATAMKVIRNAPAVTDTNVGGKWIPCSERLPKYSYVYQITRKVFEGECTFYIADCAYFDGQNTWHSDNRVNHGREYLKDVIAWCPLQPAYKGE